MRTVHKTLVMPQVVYARTGSVSLEGELYVPESARGIVFFLHGSGSSRHSTRDRAIAMKLHEQGYATFLFGLLTLDEEAKDLQTGEIRRNVGLLARRLGEVTDELVRDPIVRGLPVVYLATGTGAGAALIAVADQPVRAVAVISRGGRPDLACGALDRVIVPTLLVVGGEDRETLEMNQKAFARLQCEKELRVISGATHLFEEAGAIEELESTLLAWIERHTQPEVALT